MDASSMNVTKYIGPPCDSKRIFQQKSEYSTAKLSMDIYIPMHPFPLLCICMEQRENSFFQSDFHSLGCIEPFYFVDGLYVCISEAGIPEFTL